MQLLCFAHRGEAKAFIHEFNLSKIDDDLIDLYGNENVFLLITGEGIQSTTESLSYVLTKFPDISEVWNFGIAVALDANLNINKVYDIRSIYIEKNDQSMSFQSFTTMNDVSTLDLVTSFQRVLSNAHSDKLRPFAQIVDREAWAIASVCKRFKKPFYVYKLISDFTGNDVNCFDISLKADEFSDLLLRKYLSLNKDTSSSLEQNEEIKLPHDFYVTVSQRRQLENVLSKLELKLRKNRTEILNEIDISAIIAVEKLPKKRTSKLIDTLLGLLNPINHLMMNRLEDVIKPLTKTETQVRFDQNFEDTKFQLSVMIHDSDHLDRFKNAINTFDYDALMSILNGNFKEK